jgi:hypothetical protein
MVSVVNSRSVPVYLSASLQMLCISKDNTRTPPPCRESKRDDALGFLSSSEISMVHSCSCQHKRNMLVYATDQSGNVVGCKYMRLYVVVCLRDFR